MLNEDNEPGFFLNILQSSSMPWINNNKNLLLKQLYVHRKQPNFYNCCYTYEKNGLKGLFTWNNSGTDECATHSAHHSVHQEDQRCMPPVNVTVTVTESLGVARPLIQS